MNYILGTIGVALAIVGTVVGLGMGIYAFIGFTDWLFRDPFNWVSDTPTYTYQEPKDFQLCRDSGGIPIRSAWDGRLKRCDKAPE